VNGNCADSRSIGTAIDHRLKPHLVRTTFDICHGEAIERHSDRGPAANIVPVKKGG
jgi:hypothetical protein